MYKPDEAAAGGSVVTPAIPRIAAPLFMETRVVTVRFEETAGHGTERSTALTRWRRILTVAAATLAIADVAIVVVLLSGYSTRVRLGFRIVQPHDVLGATQLGALLCAIVAASAWRQRAIRVVALVATTMMLLVALTVHAGSGERHFPIGDHALIELYTGLAPQGKLLVGPYSRFAWHHPGPMYFWVAAPFYALAKYHTGGLAVAVLVINAASIGTILWIGRRFASPQLLVTLAIGLTAYIWRIEGIFLSLWNPFVVVLPAMALATICGAIATGRAGLIPVAVLFASFAAQTHVGLLPYCVSLTAVAIVICIVTAGGRRSEWLDVKTRRSLNISAWLLVVLWIGPIAEQLTNAPGNLTQLWRFFAADHERPTWQAAYVAWANNVAALLLPDLRLMKGKFVASAASWPLAWAAIETLLLVPAVLWLKNTGRRFDAAFASIVLAALVVSLWSVSRIVGDIVDYGLVWISAVGTLGMSVLAAAALTGLPTRIHVARFVPARSPTIIVTLLLLLLAAKTWRAFDGYHRPGQPGRSAEQARDLYDGVRTFIRDAQVRKPLLRMSAETWFAAAAIGFQFHLTGQDFAVDPAAVPLFTEVFRADGTEDVEITFSLGGRRREIRSRPGNIPIGKAGRLHADAVFLYPPSPQ
jgi:hypothetical protein